MAVDEDEGPWQVLARSRRPWVWWLAITMVLQRAVTVWWNGRTVVGAMSGRLAVLGCVVLAVAIVSGAGPRIRRSRTRVLAAVVVSCVAIAFGAIVGMNVSPSWFAPTRGTILPPDVAALLLARVLLFGFLIGALLLLVRASFQLLERAP